jgi:DNA polymerase-3 subunit delta'
MQLHQIFGHQAARKRASQAFRAARLPQVTLVTGPAGIGKQRFALWLGQLMLCEAPSEEPCGTCGSCRKVLQLSHPDLHWFVSIPRPKAGEADRQVDEAADLLAEAISARRESPLYPPSEGLAFHPLASIRLLLRRAALTPFGGGRKVFVLGEGEKLVPQESSPEAANALLKFLEEPPYDTWVVVTAAEVDRVLPTIRSRVVPIRLSRLPDSEVRAFIETVLPPSAGVQTDDLVLQAAGAIGKLAGGGPGQAAGSDRAKAVAEARALLAALNREGERFERALKQPPWSARGGFTDLLDALALELLGQARKAEGEDRLRALTTALRRVEVARQEAQGNVNPQLVLADLAGELVEVL